MKQLLKKLSLIKTERITNKSVIKVDNSLYILRLFGFTIGLFSVSAGLFLNISKVQIIPIETFNQIGNVSIKHRYGVVINIKVDDTKQIQLFVACNPKEGALTILYIIVNIISSFKIPRTNAIKNIIIVFVTVKYNPVKPYSISSNFSFEYSG